MQPKSILVFGDPAAGQALAGVLEQQGYQVTVTLANAAVVTAIRAACYDMAIADLSDARVNEELLPTLEQVERQHIERVLDRVRFNLSKASRILAIDRTTLYNKLRRFGFARDSIRARRLAGQTAAPAAPGPDPLPETRAGA